MRCAPGRITSYNVCYTKLLRLGETDLARVAVRHVRGVALVARQHVPHAVRQARERVVERQAGVAAQARITSYNVCYTKLLRLGETLAHEDTYHEDNMLTRGQAIRGIDPSRAVYMPLRAGEMSLHNYCLAHGSGPNVSADRRIV